MGFEPQTCSVLLAGLAFFGMVFHFHIFFSVRVVTYTWSLVAQSFVQISARTYLLTTLNITVFEPASWTKLIPPEPLIKTTCR